MCKTYHGLTSSNVPLGFGGESRKGEKIKAPFF